MRIYPYSVGELQANCYLVQEDKNALLIDPGDAASFLLEEVQRQNLTLLGVLATHGHFDHIMAVGEIQLGVPVPFYIHKKDQFLIDRLESTAEHFLGHKPIVIPPQSINFLTPGEFEISPLSQDIEGQVNFKFQILHTPGHTPGSVCFYFPEEKVIFTGDTLFSGAIGRTDLSYSNKGDMKSSLKKLSTLPEEVTVYPGHGEETIIANEIGSTLF